MANTLRVLARGGILVLDVEHASSPGTQGKRAYVGRETVRQWHVEKLPPGVPTHIQSNEFLEVGELPIPHCAYPALPVPVEVPGTRYFKRAVAEGDLWAADRETAIVCGASFDPTFGGEYPSLTPKRGKDRE